MLHMSIFPVDSCLLTPLHFAAGRNKLEVVLFLIKDDADFNARDNHGNTLAAVTGSCDTLRALGQAGADISAKTRFGWTPIDQASITKNQDAVGLLRELGSDGPGWMSRQNPIGQFLSLSPCPMECYNLLNNEFQ